MTFLKPIINQCRPYTQPALRCMLQLLLGMAVGAFLLAGISRFTLFLGSGLEQVCSVLITVSLATFGAKIAHQQRWSSAPQSVGVSLAAFWLLLQPSLFTNLTSLLQRLSMDAVTAPWSAALLTLAISIVSLGPLLFAAIWILSSCHNPSTAEPSWWSWTGMASSLLVLPVVLLSWCSVVSVTVMAVILAAVAIFGLRALSVYSDDRAKDACNALSSEPFNILSQLPAMLAGACLAVAFHVANLLFANSLYLQFTLFGSVLIGGILGNRFAQDFTSYQRMPCSTVLAMCYAILLLATFAPLAEVATSTTAWVSTTSLIFASRSGMLLLLALPIGLSFGCSGNFRDSSASTSALNIALFSLGFGCALWSGLSTVQVAMTVSGIGLFGCLLGWGSLGFAVPQQRWQRAGLSCAGLLIVAAGFCSGNFVPRKFERILFSGQAFASLRQGVDIEHLTWMDDSRLLTELEPLSNRWSVWQHRSAQVVIRCDGMPVDYVSASTDFCPNVVSEVAPSLYPLILHPTAEHVLVLGLHPSTVQTCSEFPLRSVTTIEDSPVAPTLIQSLREQGVLREDVTQKFLTVNNSLALRTNHGQAYDIIVAPRSRLMEADGAQSLLVENYQQIARHLAPRGIFSQRLPYYDLGPETVLTIAKSLQQAFSQVVLVEPVAGELLFLASQQSESLITERVVDQLQFPQARRVMSQIGWDWAVPLSRGSLDVAALQKLTKEVSPQTLRQGGLGFALPVEVSRWGNKSQATRQVLAQHGTTLGSFLGDIPAAKEVSERLEDLRLAQGVLADHPEQFWAYRSLLKKQLKERPRSKVMNVKYEGVKRTLHPEDQRRKDYLVALGKAATEPHPTAEQIAEVSKFAIDESFDPLVNYFVNHEVALLCERAAEPVPALELYHRLRAIYFAPAQAKSVRDVCRAITLLAEGDCELLSSQERWDHLNGLLEVMKQRWRMRINDANNASTYEPIDTEKSIAAIDLALETLNQERDSAVVSNAAWEMRCELVDDHLLRPLRRHRSNQLNGMGIPTGK